MIALIITKGQKVEVTKGRTIPEIGIGLIWQTEDLKIDINASAFLLNEHGICSRDEDMIFYNQTTSRLNAVIHSEQVHGDRESIHITVAQVPDDISKVAITLTIHEGELNGHSFAKVQNAVCRIYNYQNGEEIGQFNFGQGLSDETAIVIGELYLHNGEWKFNAIGSGFNGGLMALVQSFGLDVSEDVQAEVSVANETIVPVPDIPAPAAPIHFVKLELKKEERVKIQKSAKVTATLEWEAKKDLDLYCFYVTKNDKVGKIYYRNLGSPNKTPFIQLDGDAQVQGKETIQIHRPEELKYVMFAAYSAISNGFGSFKKMKARAVVDNHQGQVVTAPLHQKNNFAYWVAIAQIDFTSENEMQVSHVEKYSRSGVEQSPLLYPDGTFKMDVGPVEFKT
ncbi:TerD family protein [Paenibacillus pini]|uniref:TerD family protein n=1 Tax=Paenibacillus pini TaxID=669461 RepID=UPI0005609E14|nr:TerD family protein [Paenibacillus pini]